MHCPDCNSLIFHTFGGIPYCPNADCGLPIGAHDWELVPIIMQMEANKRLWEAIGLVPRKRAQPPEPDPPPAPRHCWNCGSTLKHCEGIGLYCPDSECEVVDEVSKTAEEFRRRRAREAGKGLTRALRRGIG